MRASLTFGLTVLLMVSAFGTLGTSRQLSERVPVKFVIRHADPWAVKAMIEGTATDSPEISSVRNLIGAGTLLASNTNGSGSALLQAGFLVVNPTDNSLWWYPKAAK